MACPLPYSTSERVANAAQAEHRNTMVQTQVTRVVQLHNTGLGNKLISTRLGISVPTVVKYLKLGGLSGASAKSSEE